MVEIHASCTISDAEKPIVSSYRLSLTIKPGPEGDVVVAIEHKNNADKSSLIVVSARELKNAAAWINDAIEKGATTRW
jgi:hypothetical protein